MLSLFSAHLCVLLMGQALFLYGLAKWSDSDFLLGGSWASAILGVIIGAQPVIRIVTHVIEEVNR